ncbi:DUF202 domain-containing protein [Rahnella bruchi]|uniref:YidH family protein n=1 Tax=Rahnella bruchi TaxID=1510573 RepID=UPI000EA0A6CB|nr:DUF202 domain-containing protein [Rahnella bruchi]
MKWKTEGKPPDYRYTLANERTFLAWIRTALAFMAAAIGIDQLAAELAPALFRDCLVVALGLTAAGLSCYAWRRWSGNERAMRLDTELPFPQVLLWLCSGLVAGIVAILVMLVTL